MKAQRLAQALERMTHGKPASEVSSAVDSFVAYIKKRGYLGLLPRILIEFQKLHAQSAKSDTTVVVAKETDIASILAKHQIDTADTKVDPSIIGGYQIETEGSFIDASHKSALIKLYQSLTR